MMSAHNLLLFQQEQSLTGSRKWSFSATSCVQHEEKRSTLVYGKCCLNQFRSLFRRIYFPVDRMEVLWKRVYSGLPLNGPDT
jgi:hypothetical protein